MAEMTPQVSEVLEKAMTLSTQERGLLIDHLIESLDEGPAEEGVEEAWGEEDQAPGGRHSIGQGQDDLRRAGSPGAR